MKRLTLITSVLALSTLFLGTAVSHPAQAADDAATKAAKAAKAASPAKTHIDMVEFRINSVTKKLAEEGWSQGEGDLNGVYNGLTEINQRIGYIKQKDPAWDVKAYQAFLDKSVKSYEAALAAANKKQADANLAMDRVMMFTSLKEDYRNPIATGFSVMDGSAPASLSDIQTAIDDLQKLKEVDKLCKDNQFVAVQSSFQNKPPAQQPVEVCGMAAKRPELLKQFVPLAAKAHLAARIAEDNEAIGTLESEGWLTSDTAARFANPTAYSKQVADQFASAISKASVKFDGSYFKPVEQSAPTFASTLANAAKKNRFPTQMTATDGAMQPKVQSIATALGGKLVKFKMAPGQWGVSKNELGIPLEKWNVGAAALSVGQESYCRVYPQVQFSATYTGGGTYAQPVVASGIDQYQRFQVSVCK